MGMSTAITTCLSKYATFAGRASRPEYWWFALFVILVSIVLSIVDAVAFGTDPQTGETRNFITTLFQLAVFLPMLAAGWRRLHDSARPGWYILLPMLVSLVLLVGLFSGIFAFGVAESQMTDAESMTGLAAIFGGAGLLIIVIVQLVLAILMIWWLTRPSEPQANEYGPEPVRQSA